MGVAGAPDRRLVKTDGSLVEAERSLIIDSQIIGEIPDELVDSFDVYCDPVWIKNKKDGKTYKRQVLMSSSSW